MSRRQMLERSIEDTQDLLKPHADSVNGTLFFSSRFASELALANQLAARTDWPVETVDVHANTRNRLPPELRRTPTFFKYMFDPYTKQKSIHVAEGFEAIDDALNRAGKPVSAATWSSHSLFNNYLDDTKYNQTWAHLNDRTVQHFQNARAAALQKRH